jgi:hypothetical protein
MLTLVHVASNYNTCQWCGARHNRIWPYCSNRCAHKASEARGPSDGRGNPGCGLVVVLLICWATWREYPMGTLVVGGFFVLLLGAALFKDVHEEVKLAKLDEEDCLGIDDGDDDEEED